TLRSHASALSSQLSALGHPPRTCPSLLLSLLSVTRPRFAPAPAPRSFALCSRPPASLASRSPLAPRPSLLRPSLLRSLLSVTRSHPPAPAPCCVPAACLLRATRRPLRPSARQSACRNATRSASSAGVKSNPSWVS